MAELVYLAQNFMNSEDAIIAKKRKRAKRIEANSTCHYEEGPHPKKGQIKIRKTEITKRQALWHKINSTRHSTHHFSKFSCKSRTILP